MRCAALYCAAHGDAACDDCSQPATGLPSPVVFRTVVGLYCAAVMMALVLLLFRPRLPGEHPPPPGAGAPAPTRAPTSSGGRAAPPAAGAATAPATAAAPETYVVKPGDTLGAIAAQLGVPLDALVAANPSIDPANLQIGMQLTVPNR